MQWKLIEPIGDLADVRTLCCKKIPLYLVKHIPERVCEVCRGLGDIHVVYQRYYTLVSKYELCHEAEVLVVVDASWRVELRETTV